MRLQGNLNAVRVPSPAAKPNFLVNKPHMVLNSVQNRFNFELDGWSPFGVFVCCSNHRLTPPTETRHLPLNLFLSQPRFLRPAACAPFFSVVVNFLTSPRQVTHKLCYRAIFLMVPLRQMSHWNSLPVWEKLVIVSIPSIVLVAVVALMDYLRHKRSSFSK
jgi:hypothetical protein